MLTFVHYLMDELSFSRIENESGTSFTSSIGKRTNFLGGEMILRLVWGLSHRVA